MTKHEKDAARLGAFHATPRERLLPALEDCTNRLERCAVLNGTDPQFAAEAVRQYRELIKACKENPDGCEF